MRNFSSKSLQNGSTLPWFGIPDGVTMVPLVWGINIKPTAIYISYDSIGGGIGDPISYTWSALLDPADTPLPDWITETTPPPAPADNTIP